MFTLKLGNVSYGVRFQYRPVYLEKGDSKGEYFVETPAIMGDARASDSIRTVCQILKLNDTDRTSELVVEGQVTCTMADQFVKSEGRERAFKKALANSRNVRYARFSKNERKVFWQAYFANHKNKRHLVEVQ